MKSYQVIRTHVSPYQHPDFANMERKLLETLPGIQYQELDQADPNKLTILITNTHTQVSKLAQDVLHQTKLIIHPNSGYDNFTQDVKIWEKIPVVIGHEIRAQAVAEYSLSSLFQGFCELPQHLAWSKTRIWERTLLKGQRVLVFGYGHIGKIVTATLHALGMEVVVIDPYVTECPYPLYSSWKEVPLRSQTKAVVASMSLNSSSAKIFNQDFFRSLGNGVIFINGARGGLVDEDALRTYLLSHPQSTAFLDVFNSEPFGEEWHHFPQVWKTSHIAGVHSGLDQGILDFEKKVLENFLKLSEGDFLRRYQDEILQNKWRQGELI